MMWSLFILGLCAGAGVGCACGYWLRGILLLLNNQQGGLAERERRERAQRARLRLLEQDLQSAQEETQVYMAQSAQANRALWDVEAQLTTQEGRVAEWRTWLEEEAGRQIEQRAYVAALEERLAVLVAGASEREAAQARARRELEARLLEREAELQALMDREARSAAVNARTAHQREALVWQEAALQGGSGKDDLKRIRGIGPTLERVLHDMGVTTFRQIARWQEEDLRRVEERLQAFRHRVRKDNWVGRAQEEHRLKYGEAL